VRRCSEPVGMTGIALSAAASWPMALALPPRTSRQPRSLTTVALAAALRALLVATIMVTFGLAVTAAQAQRPTVTEVSAARPGQPFDKLPRAQRDVLAPLKDDWMSLSQERQRKWLEIAARYPRMSAEEQQRLQRRMTDWAQRTPEERHNARLQYREARRLHPDDRRARWEAYQAMTQQQRDALAEEAAPRRQGTGPAAPRGGALGSSPNAPGRIAPPTVQGAPGATTRLLTEPALPPGRKPLAVPRAEADVQAFDRNTLLPRREPRSANTLAPPAPAPRP
jgi:hypothetical protein